MRKTPTKSQKQNENLRMRHFLKTENLEANFVSGNITSHLKPKIDELSDFSPKGLASSKLKMLHMGFFEAGGNKRHSRAKLSSALAFTNRCNSSPVDLLATVTCTKTFKTSTFLPRLWWKKNIKPHRTCFTNEHLSQNPAKSHNDQKKTRYR